MSDKNRLQRVMRKASGDVEIKVDITDEDEADLRDFKNAERALENHERQDRYVQQVKEKFEQRSQTGIKKYNTTLERDDLSIIDWITHAQEEAMDLTLYLEVLKEKLK